MIEKELEKRTRSNKKDDAIPNDEANADDDSLFEEENLVSDTSNSLQSQICSLCKEQINGMFFGYLFLWYHLLYASKIC